MKFALFVQHSLAFGAGLLATSASAQLVSYTFGTTASQLTTGTTTDAHLVVSPFASSKGGGTIGTASPGSAMSGGGGGAYFVASNWRSSDGNFFYFTLTPANGYSLSLTNLSFYYLATSSGPTNATITSSFDNHTSALASFSLSRAATSSLLAADWKHATSSITLASLAQPVTLRINATGATGSSGGLRIDQVILEGTTNVAAIPEPSTYAAVAGLIALLGAELRRRHRPAGRID